MSDNSIKNAEEFLAISAQFKLGGLTTEASHPATLDLSEQAKNDLPAAIRALKSLDDNTADILAMKMPEICGLKNAIHQTLESGRNIFFCGCGATGRLSLTIETLWRQVHEGDPLCNRVFSFMAGGDVALIRSIENFEDYPAYGAKQLEEAGFTNGDLLVGTTEGGETPWVIGAVERAAALSSRKPYFLYCNPDDLLMLAAERSKLVIENPSIVKINLTVGPMAVTGSTRMQASTILLAAAGHALLGYDRSDKDLTAEAAAFVNFWKKADLGFIAGFTRAETDFYTRGEYLLYQTDDRLGITIMTDTTERSPTFSLYPFENENEPGQPLSLCYLYMPGYGSSREAWAGLLHRSPRTLEWPEIDGIASMKRLTGFDFSAQLPARRKKLSPSAVHHRFNISLDETIIHFSLEDNHSSFTVPFSSPLFIHLALKMILNTHSTLVMGRLGRYDGNVMTCLRSSNNKLIDRSLRYIDLLLRRKDIHMSYEELTYLLFEVSENNPFDNPIVLAAAAEAERRWKQKK